MITRKCKKSFQYKGKFYIEEGSMWIVVVEGGAIKSHPMNKAAYGRIRGHNFFFGFLDIFVWDEMAQNRASWTASSLLMFEIFDQHLFF